ncbi:DUF2971 domain-containing protein [Pectobacterium versatile]|uniref:DUF2971 domain-containing protein n=1 Tax=Pectobacterium odoriferum TaxID=78398 RepID=A0ABR4VTS5_9GAMM|nr:MULTISPECIES: DUF2971 domain-containing protein [Pectobacterium]KGA42785.1 hypothetical protein KU75_02695 [Pectobacterium odoriferum]MBA0164079.1 DUF2971 domain-containing protein [Pectobacterium versatile]
MRKKPSSFFKFVSFERKDILESGQVRFAPIGEFNDPFELEPVITPLSRNFLGYISHFSEEDFENIDFSEEDRAFSLERELQLDAYQKIYKEKIKDYGVLSLTSNVDVNPLLSVCVPEKKDPRTNILLWSHYAKSHSGFVIEFDAEFIPGLEIGKVNYSNYRDYLTFEDIDDNNFQKIFYKKSEEWGYEQEYRAVLPLSKASKVIGEKFHLFDFNKKSIRSITFGCAMDEDKKQEIIELIESDDEFGGVHFNHALLNDDDFCLQFYHTSGRWTNHPSPFGVKLFSSIPQQKKL